MVDVDWVARSSRSTLLSHSSLGDRFLSTSLSLAESCEEPAHCILVLVEELSCHHHLLLKFALVGVGGLALIDQIEKLSLVACCRPVRGSDPVVSHPCAVDLHMHLAT